MRTRHTKEAVLNLEQQKKQSRELLQAIRSGNADALYRLRRHHARWASLDDGSVRQLVSVHDAQFVLAREQGFASWPKLKAYAEPSSRSRHTRLFVTDVAWINDRVHGLRSNRFANGTRAFPIRATRRSAKLPSPRRMPNWSMPGSTASKLGTT